MAMTLLDERTTVAASRPMSQVSYAPFVATAGSAIQHAGVTHLVNGHVEAVLPAWRSLASREATQPYVQPDWIAADLRAFEPAARLEFWAAQDETGITAALPLIRERTRMFGVPVRKLRSPGRPTMPDRFDILTTTRESSRAGEELWNEISRSRDWDVIELVDLPREGPGWSMLELARSQGFDIGYRVSRQSPYLTIPAGATSIDDVIGATTAKFRANVRRRMRNLRATGDVQLHRWIAYDDAVFTRFLELEHSGWKGQNGTSILSDSRTTAYYRELAQLTADLGYLTMYSLECDGQPVAMHFGVSMQGHYSVPKLAYSEAHQQFAPGHLLVHEVLSDLVARGYSEFDFQGDQTPWKVEWTDQLRVHFRAHIFNKTVAGRAAGFVRYDVVPAARQLKRRVSARTAENSGGNTT